MKNPKYEAYIADAPAYAQPILRKVRALFHKAFPGIEETMKWGHLTFEHKGIVGGMSAHKEHVRFGFWKAKLIPDLTGYFATEGQSGWRMLKKVSDLPPDTKLVGWIKAAVELNAKGVKVAKKKPAASRAELVVPSYFAAALKRNKAAQKTFDGMSYTNRKDYLEWIVGAKQEATREKRIATALEWLAEGKPRNWKYM
jgi:uncharacterized protein YdeI (YjbR/CyaY-like superfamily)